MTSIKQGRFSSPSCISLILGKILENGHGSDDISLDGEIFFMRLWQKLLHALESLVSLRGSNADTQDVEIVCGVCAPSIMSRVCCVELCGVRWWRDP